MISRETFEACVLRAGLAPTVHNTQPARWTLDGDVITLFCDTDVGLSIGDPTGRAAALSCGAVLEGMVLALSAYGFGAQVMCTRASARSGQGLVAMAHLTVKEGAVDGMNTYLEQRFTFRGPFEEQSVELFGWTRPDMRLVLDEPGRTYLAERNDWASFEIMQTAAFRKELVGWMRLGAHHPRAGIDGMDAEAMRMSTVEARLAPWALTTLWPVLNRLGVTKGLTSEAKVTLTAPLIALFHMDKDADDLEVGRAYLRLCLEAASLGFAGWPMAALSDHPHSNAEVCARFGIGADRRFVQAIRFGKPTGPAPTRARRPLGEVVR